MLQLLQNRWVQTGAIPLVALGVAAAVSFLVIARGAGDASEGGRLFLTTGSSSAAGQGSPSAGGTVGLGGAGDRLPGTAVQALADLWNEAATCAAGRGRYFQQKGPDESESYLLIYDQGDQLIGVYLYTMAEMPAPWQRMEQLQGSGGKAILDFEHWGLFVYTRDPIGACAEAAESGG